MTRISPTLYPAPAGHTKAAPTHGTKARSCREQFGALTSVKGNQCAPTEGVPTPPLPLGHPQQNTRFYSVAVPHTVDSEGGCHVPVSRAGCTVKEGYYSSETRRLCSGIESPRQGPRSRAGHTIPQAFERLNAPQMRRDRMDSALPPVWLMLIAAATCVLTMLLADTLYREFFEWITGVSL